MKLTKQNTVVFKRDDYDEVVMIELDWLQDVTWENGDLNDGYESIRDYFEYSKGLNDGKWYENIQDCIDQVNPFTEIEG
ncbi:hypothetical protein A616_16685 [Brevibacillus brevis X23]|nr:hypothetical protein A616_16685 [Brevibacillus brevis X23]